MQIFIKTVTGKIITLDCETCYSIKDLMQLCCNGIKYICMLLYFCKLQASKVVYLSCFCSGKIRFLIKRNVIMK